MKISLRHGFTIIELLVVICIIGISASVTVLALPDGNQKRLEKEALRLGVLLDAARSYSRVVGVPAYWRPTEKGFQFFGGGKKQQDKTWLVTDEPISVLITTTGKTVPFATLGPEPLIAQHTIILSSGSYRAVLSTDGLSPFSFEVSNSK